MLNTASLEVVLVPVLLDNYAYLLRDASTGAVGVIDPSETDAVVAAWRATGWKAPILILNTHHHWDHVGGNQGLQEIFGCDLICSQYDAGRVPGKVSRAVVEGDAVRLGDSVLVTMEIPGHTLGHVAWYCDREPAVFVGDTLFGMGCGRLFEGTAEVMWASLSRLKSLPKSTAVYCGHEYTEANGRFAETVDPENHQLAARIRLVRDIRRHGKPTIPFTIADELATNPFLRSSLEVFREFRDRKNRFG